MRQDIASEAKTNVFEKKILHFVNPLSLKCTFVLIFEHFSAVELFLYMGRQIALLSLGMQSIFSLFLC